jgi:hypothetical protein
MRVAGAGYASAVLAFAEALAQAGSKISSSLVIWAAQIFTQRRKGAKDSD